MSLKQGFILEKKVDKDKDDFLELKKYSVKDSEEIFRSLSDAKLGTIQGTIDDINDLILTRGNLSKEIFNQLDKMSMEINNSLIETRSIINSLKSNKDEAVRAQLELRKKIIDLEEVRVQEKVNNWRDIALLKKELRETIKEFKEKESSVSLLDKILEDTL